MNGLRVALGEIESIAQRATPALNARLELLICPPATLLAQAVELAAGRLAIGGQDCHAQGSGAFTGDVSAPMLADAGAKYVILGHSERRSLHGESDADVLAKALAARAAGLCPIICVGEVEGERRSGRALAVVAGQLEGSLPADVDLDNMVIAYEPVWAIGTGLTPTVANVEEMHAMIRSLLVRRYGAAGQGVRILYGGSVKPSNAGELMAAAHVNGALVGGASLKAADFLAIAAAV